LGCPTATGSPSSSKWIALRNRETNILDRMHELLINGKIDETQTIFQKMKNRAKHILKIYIPGIVRNRRTTAADFFG
jgi:hypothetical protein